MNYRPFLNPNSISKNKNRYITTTKKKSARTVLIFSTVLLAMSSLAATLLASSGSPRTETEKLSTASNPHKSLISQKTTELALPVISYTAGPVATNLNIPAIAEPEQTTEANQKSSSEAEVITAITNISKVKQETPESTANNKAPQITRTAKNSQQLTNDLLNKTLKNTLKSDQTGKTEQQHHIVKTVSLTPGKSDNPNKTLLIKVKKGDTLSSIFKRHKLSSSSLYKIINSGKEAARLTHIKPGQTFSIALNNDNDIIQLEFQINKVDTLFISQHDKGYSSEIRSKEIETRQQFTAGIINNSLFAAGQKAGLNSTMIMQLAHIFGWDIDFALDIRKGDSFAILYEERYVDGKKLTSGNILSAEFVNQGKVFRAIRYSDASGHTDYYSEKGLSMRKAFLRTPVAFSRISSRFSTGRKHPILNRIRAHKGVDYAASRGTPIKAVGDGKVIFKGRKGGYGRVIILQHGSKYTTLYAHMSAYNKKLHTGSRVEQGQTIGYVGMSGLATGPHLHYEFRINGVHRNPLTVKLPSAAPISKKYRADFKVAAETLISQLKLRKQETIALNSQ